MSAESPPVATLGIPRAHQRGDGDGSEDLGAGLPAADVPMTWGPGAAALPTEGSGQRDVLAEGLDLDEERALHDAIKRRRTDVPDLDPATEAVPRRILTRDTHADTT
jgi:hypothetical protein